jgi:hypothetical protein
MKFDFKNKSSKQLKDKIQIILTATLKQDSNTKGAICYNFLRVIEHEIAPISHCEILILLM